MLNYSIINLASDATPHPNTRRNAQLRRIAALTPPAKTPMITPMETFRNTLHHEDCLKTLQRMPDRIVQTCYMDPPYNTGRNMSPDAGGYRDTWNFKDAPDVPGTEWIEEIYGKTATTGYLRYLAERLLEIQRVLTETGSLFLHVDRRESGRLRVLLDMIFGVDNFRNMIVWHYGTHPKVYPKRAFYSNCDHILYYAKGEENVFHPQYRPLTQAQIIETYYHVDPNGRRYRNTGRFVRDVSREYADESPGFPISDHWEIPICRPKERTGYPTQKPLALLRRIIKCASREGDLILDPFCGSGTTLLAANRLERDYCGVDTNATAIETARHRLQRPGIQWKTRETGGGL